MEVLHIGPMDKHWFGCDEAGKAMMAKYVYHHGLARGIAHFSPEDAARAGEIPGRVEVPGYAPTGYHLPCERRD